MARKTRKTIIWPAIRRDYETGAISNYELAAWHGVTESTIRYHAKNEGWGRSRPGIKPKGGRPSKVAKAHPRAAKPKKAKQPPQLIVETIEPEQIGPAPVEAQSPPAPGPPRRLPQIRRLPITEAMCGTDALSLRGRELVLRMLDELDASTSHRGELEQMIVTATATDSDTRRRAAMLRAVDLPVRAAIMKALASTIQTLASAGAVKPAAEANTPQGKKAIAQQDAKTAGLGSDWGDDLMPAHVN